jgi:Tol biopolymer transport system component
VKATSGTPADNISNPSVNSAGTIVAFEAFGSFENRCSGPAASRRQIFIKDITSGKTTAVTCFADGDSSAPSLNDAGGSLVFVSTTGLYGGPVGVPQVYVYQYFSPEPRPDIGQIIPISHGAIAFGTAPSGAPMLNKLGTHVAFESRANLLGDGADTGRWNIFWFDRQLGRIFQITNANADSRNPYVEEKRPGRLFFDSTATDLQGTDGLPGGRQVYSASIDQSSDFPLLEQWTFGPGQAWAPAVEPNGGKVLFLSDGDLLANGTSGPRIFAIDYRTTQRVLYQITGRGNVGPRLGANLGSWFVSFDSDDDVGGYGACGRQVWIVTYDPTHYTEGGHQRLAATAIGQKPGEPAPGNPNLGCADGKPCTADACIGRSVCTHQVLSDGTVCAEGDACQGGVATCAAGICARQDTLDCDDSNKCTDDTCDATTGCAHTDVDCDDGNKCTDDTCEPATGCAHTPIGAMAGVSCQSDVVRSVTPSQGSKKVLKQLRRAQNLILRVKNKKPKAVRKNLKQAAKLFNAVLPDITTDPQIPRAQASDLVEQIYGLLDQIRQVLNGLKSQPKGSK